jgi:alpha-beta hydrolase superfamily lysophospholipase
MRDIKMRVHGPYGEIPLLLVQDGGKFRGTVVLYHGLHSHKYDNRKELEQLAQRGFLAVGVDAIAHGERRAVDFEEQVRAGFDTMLRWIEESADEVPVIVDALTELVGDRLGKVGLTGISMGGYITFAAALREKRAAALVPILGSPDWTSGGKRTTNFSSRSPHLKPEAFAGRPLLALNAGKDESVPPKYARDFVESLRPHYTTSPARLEYFEYRDAGHFLNEGEWTDLWKRTGDWFETHLVTPR